MSQDCANPLLLAWIKEWHDKAKEQNSKGYFTYRKAYDSMKACPITFEHPSQAKELHGIGPKLCDRLTEKLEAHCKENGTTMPEDPLKARQKKKKRDSNEVDDTSVEETVPVKKVRKTKQYVPTLRTGPYAILLALSTLSETSSAGLTKQHLIETAQPHCDASFTAPADPSKTYTAWSSMKTLQTKDLVYLSGGARKTYTLTDEGWDVAKKIKAAAGLTDAAILEPEGSTNELPDIGAFPKRLQEAPRPQTSSQNRRERSLGRSQTNVTSNFTVLGGIDEGLGPQDGTGPQHLGTEDKEPSLPKQKRSSKLERSYIEKDFVEILSSSPKLFPEKPEDRREALRATQLYNRQTTNNTAASLSIDKAHSNHVQTTSSQSNPSFNAITIPPSAYTIELLLDNREVRSKSDRDYIQSGLLTNGIRPTTRALPVGDALWVARLTDPSLLQSRGEEGDEVVLDHILERKRLDDLVGSIKDGRFTEQKFRLKKSGATSVTYLVEDYSLGSETQAYYHEHVCSAIANTMVVSGFFLKRTKSVDDTIAYLARLTRMLRTKYAGRSLHVIPSDFIDANSSSSEMPLPSLRAALQGSYYVTYAAFSNLSSKSDTLTLRDVFLKMLMCARGVTGEKALEIQRHWKTPRALVEAMKSASDNKTKEDLIFKKLGGGVGRRKVGKAASKRIGEVWGGVR